MQMKDETRARELLVEYGIKLLDTGLVQGTWGNLSIRLDDQYMICTPSGRDYRTLGPEDMVKVDLKTLEYEGDIKPTSEKTFHAAIYDQRPELGAIIHTHSKYCCIYACCNMPMRIKEAEPQRALGELIHVSTYALSGTKALSRNVVKALGRNNACLMSHHGMLSCGEDIQLAFRNAFVMEDIAMNEVERRWKRFHQ